jgi:hypothetical protein
MKKTEIVNLEKVIKKIAEERELPSAMVSYILRLLDSARQGKEQRPTYMSSQLEKCLEDMGDES